METIPKSECVKVGFIQKPHGIHGEVVLSFQEEFEDSVAGATICFIEIEGLLVPFFITDEGIHIRTSNSAILKFDWIDSDDSARKICGCNVFLKEEEIISIDSQSIFDQLNEYLIIDTTYGEIGEIIHADDFSGNIVLTVSHSDREILIPFNEELIQKIDHKKKEIYLNLPEGLIELQ